MLHSIYLQKYRAMEHVRVLQRMHTTRDVPPNLPYSIICTLLVGEVASGGALEPGCTPFLVHTSSKGPPLIYTKYQVPAKAYHNVCIRVYLHNYGTV